MKAYLPLLLLASCALPDNYGLSGSYGEGSIDGPANYDQDNWVALLSVGWSPGDSKRHTETLTALRRLEIATVTGNLQPITISHDAEPAEPESIVDAFLPDIPETEVESWNLVRWAGAIVLLAVAALIFHLAGLRLPFLGKKK